MKRISVFASLLVLGSLVLAACAAPAAPPAEQPQAPAPTAEQPSAPQAEAPTSMPAAPAAPAAPAPAGHTDVPGEPPDGKGTVLGDQSTTNSALPKRALVGDRFSLGKFERPYNANTMDTYFPNLDIDSANLYAEGMWDYVRINMVGADANGALPGQFAVEVDEDRDGRGDFLVFAENVTSKEWTTDGVKVLMDANADVGGENIINSDSQGAGDGYESPSPDADAGWVRLSPSSPNSVEFAFKQSLVQSGEHPNTFLAGLWAASGALDPSKFDLDDHYTHEQAGAALDDLAAFYPIKGLAEMDNTCRVAFGFNPDGTEADVCAGQ